VTQFQVGRTYQTRSICDHDCIITATIVSRTAKRLTADTQRGRKVFGIGQYDGVEFIRPWGNYSMSPIIRADK